MNKFIWALLGLLVVSPGFVGCEKRADEESNVRDVKSVATASEAENIIKARLDADDQLKASDLSVEVNEEKGLATLSGTVASESLHAKAMELARSAQPELTIEDHIVVKPTEVSRQEYTEEMAKDEWRKAREFGEKVGNQIEDTWIHSKIVAKLVANSNTQERTIDVDVVNSNVTLRGTARKAAQKSEAEHLARETEGVKSVNNQIEVAA
jgi:hyperosmotically inducible periplasmic protein